MAEDHGDLTTPEPNVRRKRTRWPIPTAAVIVPLASYGVPLAVFAGFAHDPNWADFWKTAATPYGTMTAGFAAIAAAGIAYANGQAQRETDRDTADQELAHAQQQLAATTDDADRKHDAEIVRDLRTRFTTATQQLADPTHTIQQAGAYALASLADDWLQRKNTQEAQVCINVLCTYLRTHHLGTTDEPDGSPADQPVRDTILRIIAEHLRAGRDHAWSTLDFDLTGTRLHNSDLAEVLFAGNLTLFDGALFTGTHTLFGGTHFTSELTSFAQAQFAGAQTLLNAEFTGEKTSFDRALFIGENTTFDGAQFGGYRTSFGGTQFNSERVSFGWAKFVAMFTSFPEAQFTGRTTFDGARFAGEYTSFDGAQFPGDTSFGRAEFTGTHASFAEARFAGEETWFREVQFGPSVVVNFSNPAAWNNVLFDWDDDPSQRPENVLPANWPPRVVEADEPDTD